MLSLIWGGVILMKDFFISYSGTDVKYATWVAKILEEENYSVIIQEWDFRPGDNFISKINEGLLECKKLIVILSRNYLKSKWCEAEWTAKLAEGLNERNVIPIRIEAINVGGLLSPIVYIDIVDKNEVEAKAEIIKGITETMCRGEGVQYPTPYNVEHIKIDNDYYVDDTNIVFIKNCRSKIINGGKNFISNRITWFVDETVEISSMSENVVIEKLDMQDTNINYNVVFDHVLVENEEIEYCVKVVLSNKHLHFKNFFSTEVIVPIENLYMHLNIKDKNVKKVYTQKLSSSITNTRTEKAIENKLLTTFHWHIEKPELHFEYKMYW